MYSVAVRTTNKLMLWVAKREELQSGWYNIENWYSPKKFRTETKKDVYFFCVFRFSFVQVFAQDRGFSSHRDLPSNLHIYSRTRKNNSQFSFIGTNSLKQLERNMKTPFELTVREFYYLAVKKSIKEDNCSNRKSRYVNGLEEFLTGKTDHKSWRIYV